MREIPRGEKVSRSTITLDGSTIKVVVTTKEDRETDRRVETTWSFDFSNCSDDEVLRLASKECVASAQRSWRAAKDRLNPEVWDERTFDVKREIVDAVRVRGNPVVAARNYISKLSEAELKAFKSDPAIKSMLGDAK